MAWFLFADMLARIILGRSALRFSEFSLGLPLLINFWLTNRFRKTAGRFEKSVMALGVLVLVSAMWGDLSASPTDFLSPTLFGIMLLLSSRRFFENRRVWWATVAMVFGCVFLLALYYFRVGPRDPSGAAFDALTKEIIGDRNYSSFHLGCGAIILWCLAYSGISKQAPSVGFLHWPLRGLFFLGFLLIVWTMLFFRSRGIIIALTAGLISSILHHGRHLRRVFAGIFLIGTLFYFFVKTPTYELLIERFQDPTMETASARTEILKMVFKHYFAQNPISWVFGWGLNDVWAKFSVSTHNTFVRILVEQGIVGLSLLTYIFALSIWQAWKNKDCSGNLQFALLIFLVVSAMSLEPHYQPFFWICLALAAPFRKLDPTV